MRFSAFEALQTAVSHVDRALTEGAIVNDGFGDLHTFHDVDPP